MRQFKVSQSITSRESLSLVKYLLELSRIELLTPDEETVLAAKIKNGDHQAMHRFTRGNLRFVVSVAKQYQHKGIPLCDLISEGNIGLIKAAQNFDATKGFKFISYAVWWIRQTIMQAINEKARLVRLPANKVILVHKLNHTSSQLAQSLEREPDASEIADLLELEEKEVTAIQRGLFHISLDAPLNEADGTNTLLDQLPAADHSADSRMQRKSLQIELQRCLATLPPVQCQILSLFFGIGHPQAMSLHMIALELNLTSERVRQIKQKAILALGTGKKRELLQAYLS